jgi:hypothetical protein
MGPPVRAKEAALQHMTIPDDCVEPPQRTVRGYKLFRIDRDHPNLFFPLFVNPNKPIPIGQWMRAEIGPMLGPVRISILFSAKT